MKTLKVLIGIQARSTSTRLPKKAFELVGDSTILERIVQTCNVAARHIERKCRANVTVAILTPTGDAIATVYRDLCRIIEGSEEDVLDRYRVAVEKLDPDYVVRITGDCPLVPALTIDYLTTTCIARGYDYLSNVDERFRTSIDGFDCEVVSRKLFEHVAAAAKLQRDREHVTTMIRRDPPPWAVVGTAINYVDLSEIKLSVDDEGDLERARSAYDRASQKFQAACLAFGKRNVVRI